MHDNENNNNSDVNKENPTSNNKWFEYFECISYGVGKFFTKLVERNKNVDSFFKRRDQIELRSKIKNNYLKTDLKEFIKPVVNIVYNEIYIYIWLICFYNVFLFFLVLANLFLILRLLNTSKY